MKCHLPLGWFVLEMVYVLEMTDLVTLRISKLMGAFVLSRLPSADHPIPGCTQVLTAYVPVFLSLQVVKQPGYPQSLQCAAGLPSHISHDVDLADKLTPKGSFELPTSSCPPADAH